MTARHVTRPVDVGGVLIGGGAPVVVQSMANTDTRDVTSSLAQIRALAAAGCELVRLAVPDLEAAEAFARIRKDSPVPLVADIHFDYRLALASLEAGADKIRINPGNIGGADRVRQVADAAKARGIPIRVGVNSGSVPKDLLAKFGGVNAQSMVESAIRAVAELEAFDFDDIVVSIKASDPLLTVMSYREMAKRTRYPLHLGVTEAGTPREGTIKSAVGIGALLVDGIGDTIRVSLTGDPVQEVRAAWSILRAAGSRRHGPELISCPTCGRTKVDLVAIAEEVERRLEDVHAQIRVAVMGCAVNGPGEAREADIGLAGGEGEVLLFAKGEVLRKVPEAQAVDELMKEVRRLTGEG